MQHHTKRPVSSTKAPNLGWRISCLLVFVCWLGLDFGYVFLFGSDGTGSRSHLSQNVNYTHVTSNPPHKGSSYSPLYLSIFSECLKKIRISRIKVWYLYGFNASLRSPTCHCPPLPGQSSTCGHMVPTEETRRLSKCLMLVESPKRAKHFAGYAVQHCSRLVDIHFGQLKGCKLCFSLTQKLGRPKN